MTVGDFVSVEMTGRACRIHRLTAETVDGLVAENFADERLFHYIPGRLARRRGFWTRLLGLPFRLARLDRLWNWAKRKWDNRAKSLIRVMSTSHDVGLQQTRLGVETVGVPFPHVLILTDKDQPQYRAAVESNVTAQLNRWWENYVDPMVPIRVRMVVNPRARENDLIVYFGDGVFVPATGERPVGRVEIRLVQFREAFEPSILDDMPGGLYRGQSALAFSGSDRRTPATSPALSGVAGVFCLRARLNDETQLSYTLDWDPSDEDEQPYAPSRQDVVPPPEGTDAAFLVQFSGGTGSFELRVIEDVRASRLYFIQPAGECLAIVGIVAPPQTRELGYKRWWIDIDRNGRLVSSAMRRPKLSVIVERGDVSIWDWSSPQSPGNYAAALERCETVEGLRNILRAAPSAPFGWLVAPQRTSRAAFASGGDATFSLDWLDFAGAVQDKNYKSTRLANHLQGSKGAVYVPGREAGDGSELILAREVGQPVFAAWRGTWHAGTQFIVGPLLLEIATRRGDP